MKRKPSHVEEHGLYLVDEGDVLRRHAVTLGLLQRNPVPCEAGRKHLTKVITTQVLETINMHAVGV